MIYLLFGFYILIALLLLKEWIVFFDTDKEMSGQMRFFSQIILILATILWPFIVPFAYRELLKFHQKHREIIRLLINLPDLKVIDTERLLKQANPTPNLSRE